MPDAPWVQYPTSFIDSQAKEISTFEVKEAQVNVEYTGVVPALVVKVSSKVSETGIEKPVLELSGDDVEQYNMGAEYE